jgi:hypothetical protein
LLKDRHDNNTFLATGALRARAWRERERDGPQPRWQIRAGAVSKPKVAGSSPVALAKPELARKFHDNAVRSLPEERAAEIAARTLALPDAQGVEDLTALLTSAGER